VSDTPAEIQTWRISLPNENGEGWAIIFMDSTGCFSAMSDWGNVAHRWPNKGWGDDDFRKFLLKCDDYYLTSKFGQNRREYDGEGALKSIQEYLNRMEQEKGLKPAVIARERDLLKEHNELYEQHDLWAWQQDTKLDPF
jgi:hypothetical protein